MAHHVTIDGYGGAVDLLRDDAVTFELLKRLPKLLGMHVIYGPHLEPWDGGLHPLEAGTSGFVLIAESHVAVHTWPSLQFLKLDISSCKEFDPSVVRHEVFEAYRLDERRSKLREHECDLGIVIEAAR